MLLLKAENTEPNCYLFKSRNPNEHFSVRGFQALKAAIERSTSGVLVIHLDGRALQRHITKVPKTLNGRKWSKLCGYLDGTDEDLVNATNLFA